MKIREKVLSEIENFVEENFDRWVTLSHTSNTHIWIEVHPDGKLHEAEEADDRTTHWIHYPDTPVACVCEIASSSSGYCDCDACHLMSLIEDVKNREMDSEEFEEKTGFIYEEEKNKGLIDLLYDYDELPGYDYYADEIKSAIEELDNGYFEDEK